MSSTFNTLTEAEALAKMGIKFSRQQMLTAFNAVQHCTNWKLGNRAWINEADADVTAEAIVFFTGSAMRVISKHGPIGRGRLQIEFDGYYKAIGP
jgi:hypothetical protein